MHGTVGCNRKDNVWATNFTPKCLSLIHILKTLPASLCAAVTHTGPYETIRYAYEAIGAWLSSHPDYEVCGPAIERYLRDENEVGDPEELQTGVLFPVKKREG